MTAFITLHSNLVPLINGLCRSNPGGVEVLVLRGVPCTQEGHFDCSGCADQKGCGEGLAAICMYVSYTTKRVD